MQCFWRYVQFSRKYTMSVCKIHGLLEGEICQRSGSESLPVGSRSMVAWEKKLVSCKLHCCDERSTIICCQFRKWYYAAIVGIWGFIQTQQTSSKLVNVEEMCVSLQEKEYCTDDIVTWLLSSVVSAAYQQHGGDILRQDLSGWPW